MQLYFIRHGQSENNASWQRTGSNEGRVSDPALTTLGRQQAVCLSAFLVNSPYQGDNGKLDLQNTLGFGFTHIYCSLMIRAVETGLIIAKALSLPLVGMMDIHESGGIHMKNPATGESEGLPGNGRSFLEKTYPELVLPDEVTDAGWWNRPFEDRDARPVRAKNVLTNLLNLHGDTDNRIAMISHGGFYNHFMGAVLGINGERRTYFSKNNTAITRIDFGSENSVVYANRVDFLPKTMIT